MTTLYWQGRLCGWITHKNGVWRALTPAGSLTHHTCSKEAMECLVSSLR
jgi:hypothetical protein